jgi:hydrogenase maturation protease
MTELLVIGYGNELRGDDGAGPRVARSVAAWHRRGVRALAVHQLTPELAAELADVERVVFVDAAVGGPGVRWQRITVGDAPVRLGHASDPSWLLALARAVAGRVPEAWLATIPARELGYTDSLSSLAATDVAAILRVLSQWLRAAPDDVTGVETAAALTPLAPPQPRSVHRRMQR